MKKRNAAVYAGVALTAVLVLGGALGIKKAFSEKEDKTKKESREQNSEEAMKAVYLENQQGDFMFVDLTNETPFLGILPEDGVYSQKEEKISGEDLNSGDVVLVWGSGVMAQSYPAQYNGITKIQVEEKGNQKYVESYSHYMEEFFPAADFSQIPMLDVSYKQPEAIVTAAVTDSGAYTWTIEKENGEKETIATDAAHILLRDNMTEISLENGTEMELLFSLAPQKTEVLRWSMEEWEKARQEKDTAEIPDGETVQVTENQAGNPVISCDAGYVYQVKGYWENGEAEYGFYTKEMGQ